MMTGKPVNIFHLFSVVHIFRALEDIEEEVVILTNLFSSLNLPVIKIERR